MLVSDFCVFYFFLKSVLVKAIRILKQSRPRPKSHVGSQAMPEAC